MRKLTILLMLLVAVSFAVDADTILGPDTNTEIISDYVAPMPDRSVLWENPYGGAVDGAYRSSGPTRSADDFSFATPGRIESIEWWGLCSSSPDSDYGIRIYDDNSGEPGTMLWEVAAITPVNTDTGDDAFGYDIYHIEVVLEPADYFVAEAGTTYWLSPFWSSTDFFWLYLTSGNLHRSSDDGTTWTQRNMDAMFRLCGTDNVSVEETTWGQIKAL